MVTSIYLLLCFLQVMLWGLIRTAQFLAVAVET